jgi:hypothetical protein
VVVWAVTPCGLIDRYKHFRGKDRGNRFLWNAGIYLQAHTALWPRIPTSIHWYSSVSTVLKKWTEFVSVDTELECRLDRLDLSLRIAHVPHVFLRESLIKYHIIQHLSQ